MEDTTKNNPFELVKAGVVAKLNQYNIPYQSWGTGSAKTLEHLVKEVEEGESVLVENEQGELIRILAALSISVYHRSSEGVTYRLREEKQIFTDGRERRRTLVGSIAEKLKGEELPDDASILRALDEELGIKSVTSLENQGEETEKSDSPSFPGLKMEMKKYKFTTYIGESEFKPEGYIENQPDKSTYFIWDK